VPFLASPVFAATAKVTVPAPLPLAPEVMESQEALLVAVPPQPPPPATVTVCPVAPAAGTEGNTSGFAVSVQFPA